MKYLIALLFIISILFLGFVPQQSDFALIVSGFALAFGSYFLLIRKTDFNTRDLLIFAVALKIVMIFAFPNLSDDIYRFIWDGKLLHLGESPFTYLPSAYIETATDPSFTTLFPLLNSPDYYSIYPPFAQVIFYISTFPGLNSSVIIKLLLLAAELFTIFFSIKLLDEMKRPRRNVLWYALNPLIIIEIMVNIHFEGFMVCFFVMSLYFLKVNKLNKAAIMISLSISAKLVPLLFLPYFLGQWVFKKSSIFYIKNGAILLLLFLPLLLQLGGFGDSLDLYFRKFEFNASIYYVLRALGTLWKGYNMIGMIGPSMALAVFSIVMLLAFRTKDFVQFCMLSLLTFLLLSTTIHPWYLALGILLSVFSDRKYWIVWSFLIVLSYSKYGANEAAYYCFVAIEYITLITFILFEIYTTRKSLPASI
ncbi:hypothetical protein [Portibacter lacus]|uniref:hypothetical protein n=1 Tax=Portibacter lacus TaxID=1099794 RepID=UPI001F2FED0E|nr:hypothetical protein [Portibacter lacus]